MSAADNLHATAVELRALPRRTLIDVAKAAKAEAARVGAQHGAPLKGHKKRGMKLRAVDTIRDSAGGASLRVQGVNVAAWVWVNTGTRPHDIRRRKRGPMRKMTVAHPGTAGRRAWDTVSHNIEVVIVPRVLRAALAKALRG